MALWLEAALALRYPELASPDLRAPRQALPGHLRGGLGAGGRTDRVVMVGDQLETDIQGARALGLDAALVTFGISPETPWATCPSAISVPTFIIAQLVSSDAVPPSPAQVPRYRSDSR